MAYGHGRLYLGDARSEIHGPKVDGEVADRPNAVITEQVTNGIAVRMAVLYLLLGSGLDLVDTQEAVA
mgnify:CR=1 FL=1